MMVTVSWWRLTLSVGLYEMEKTEFYGSPRLTKDTRLN